MRIPELIAHRGYTLHYPENTLPAVQGAIDAGARWVEVDVQLSRDEVPFLFHDKTLKRICGQPGALHDYSSGELLGFSAGDPARFGQRFSGVSLATLREFAQCLEPHQEVTAFVEVKRISVKQFGCARILHQLRSALEPVFHRCVLISFDPDLLELAQQSGWPRTGAVINHWRERKRAQIQKLKPDWLFCDVDGLPARGPLECEDTHIVIYEVDQADIALALADRGVGFIETFAFGELQRSLRHAS